MKKTDVVIVGAGPYGLSVAAHLRASGIEPYVVGKSMAFWKEHMPTGMLLRSRIEASSIDAPQKHLSVFAYQKAVGKIREPFPVEDFIAYGDWLQKQVAPSLDPRRVQSLSTNGGGFAVRFEDGETIGARVVVFALGIGL